MRSRILAVALVAVAACQSSGDDEDVGVIMLGIAAGPTDAACLRVTVTGPAGAVATRTLALTPGQSTTGMLQGLPIGAVTVRGEAFAAACSSVGASSVPNWVAAPVSAMLLPATPVSVQLVMQRPGRINVSVDWNTGGAGGAGGTAGGTGGTGATGGAGGSSSVASALDGFMYRSQCLRDTEAAVCATVNGACPDPGIPDVALRGVKMTDVSVTLGGTIGTPYSITLHVQGEVEAKEYTSSMDANSMLMSPVANGFATGGTPTQANAYHVYLLRVTNPNGGGVTNYYLNSLVGPGISNHTTYGIDYTATIRAQGGATVRLVAADPNCSMIKNCGPEPSFTECLEPLIPANVEPTVKAKNPTVNFNAAYNGQWIGLTVKSVTSP